jgi:hypothetical protein
MIYIHLLTWVGFGVIWIDFDVYVPNTLYIILICLNVLFALQNTIDCNNERVFHDRILL